MNNQDYYNKEYVPQVNKIGKITGYLGVLLSFTPALVLAVVYGILPKPAALLTAFISGASAFGVLWFVEPISYFPVVGAAGTYMAFLSGNISNMRIPCASMAQVAADVEPGTEKGSVVATLGMAVSIVINVSVLTIGAILGTSVLAMLPESITAGVKLSYYRHLFGALLSTVWNENESNLQCHYGCICGSSLVFHDWNADTFQLAYQEHQTGLATSCDVSS